MFSHSYHFNFFLISGELSTEAINHDTEENSTRRATRRGKYTIYFVHTLKRQNYVSNMAILAAFSHALLLS